jgi:PAS domain S-box-containing protein
LRLPPNLASFQHALKRVLVFVLFGLVYGLGSYLSLLAPRYFLPVSLFWIPTGIALGLVYLGGLWLLPAIFLAVLGVNAFVGSPVLTGLGFAIANTLSVGLAAYVLRDREVFDPGLKRSRDVIRLVAAAFAGSFSAACVATITVAARPGPDGVISTALHWTLAEALSMIAFAPFYLTNFASPARPRWTPPRKLECAILTFSLCVVAYPVFLEDPDRLGFFSRSAALLPFLLWAALRFNPRLLSTYMKGLAITAVAGTLLGRGAFFMGDLVKDLVELQVYVGVFCISSLLIVSISYERARLAREREIALRNIANAIPELVWTANAEGEPTYWNDQAFHYFGFEGKMPTSQERLALVHPDDLDLTHRTWQQAVARELPFAHEHRFRKADGSYEWFLSKATPLRDDQGKIVRWFGASMNIDQQRRTIVELQEERDIRDRMVFTLSHDIRNPLAVIDAGAQVLLKTDVPPELARSFLEQISANVARANRMIVDLLDANRLRAGNFISLRMEPLELVSLLKDTIKALSTVHGDIFRLDAPAELRGFWAPDEIRRITENLCANAVKYGDISRGVTIGLKETKADEVCVSIHNHGSLIAAGDQSRIFHLFHRAKESLEGDRKGWGIGLTLVQGLTAAHGGRVEVESSEERGTAFLVYLPRDARPAALSGAL